MVVGRTADGTGSDRLLARLDRQTQEIAWTHDGKWLLLRTDNGNAGAGDIVGVRTSGDTTPVPLVHSPFTELHPAPSPDGHWLAYTSNESGKNEVYVRPFPNTEDGRWQVSTGGGTEPRWAPNGRELYFLGASGHLIAAEIRPGPGFAVGSSRSLFEVTRFNDEAFHQGYEVTPDGRYFLFSAPRRDAGSTRAPQVVAAENWFADLRAKVRQ
jgi:serine/threonine-protein kinase